MKKSHLYYEKMEKVTKKYASDLKVEIEEYMPKEFFSDKDIESSIEHILNDMYEEIKPYNEEDEEYEYFTNSFGIKMKRQKK